MPSLSGSAANRSSPPWENTNCVSPVLKGVKHVMGQARGPCARNASPVGSPRRWRGRMKSTTRGSDEEPPSSTHTGRSDRIMAPCQPVVRSVNGTRR